MGNTCFLNAPLQALLNTKPMTKYFLSGTQTLKGDLVGVYQEILNQIHTTCVGSAVPASLLVYMTKFVKHLANGEQQDALVILSYFSYLCNISCDSTV